MNRHYQELWVPAVRYISRLTKTTAKKPCFSKIGRYRFHQGYRAKNYLFLEIKLHIFKIIITETQDSLGNCIY